MSFYKLPYAPQTKNPGERQKSWSFNNSFAEDHELSQRRHLERPPRGVEIRRDVPILESKAVNERRRAERAAAGVTDKKQIAFVPGDERLQDPLYYQSMGVNPNLGWDEI